MCLPSKVEAATIQRIASVVGNLLWLNFGLMFGITPGHARLYQSPETPLNRVIDEDEAVWISAYLFLGAAFGSLLFGFLCNNIGPKSVLLLSGLLQISSWFVIHFAYDILHIHASRLAAGVAAGAVFVVLPIFIMEISEKPNRAALIASVDGWRSVGILIGFTLATFVPYNYVNIIGIGASFVFTMTFPFVQESPFYHQRKGNVTALEKSLRWYRGIRDIDDREQPQFLEELAEFKCNMLSQKRGVSSTADPTPRPLHAIKSTSPFFGHFHRLRLLVICLVLVGGAQFTGTFIILNFAREIFEAIDSSGRSMNEVVLTFAAMQFIGANVATWLGEKINRRTLLCITALICGLSLSSFTLFLTFGRSWQLNPFYAPWLPLGLLSLHLLVANVGVYPLASVIIAEVMPVKLRVPLMSITAAIFWLLGFLLIKFFHPLRTSMGLVGCFSLFAAFCFFVAAFAVSGILPETRNRSFEEVKHAMGCDVPSTQIITVPKIPELTIGYIRNT